MTRDSKELGEAIKAIDKQQAEWDKKYKKVLKALELERDMHKRILLQAQLNALANDLKEIKEQYFALLQS